MITPVPYIGTGANSQVNLGHYGVSQRGGELVATIGAAGHLARIRWAPTTTTYFLCLMRLRAGWSISGAVTAAVEMTLRGIIARQFTVDFTTAITNINMAATAKTNTMRSGTMMASQMGTTGPGIHTTAVMSGQTLTADAAPFAVATYPSLTPVTATGTAVAVPVGTSALMQTLYEWTALGQHPIILSNQEGVIVQPHVAGVASGTWALYTQWEWGEVLAF